MLDFNDKKIGLISLGCDKNRVDSEKCLSIVQGRARITNDINEAEIVIINTCAFLESSRKESIDTIFEVNELRKKGVLEKIVVTGCLPAKYIKEIFDDLVEVDVFLGYKDYDLLFEALEKSYTEGRTEFVNKVETFDHKDRVLTTQEHFAYLKIADGCNNHCTYCLIPKIRGRYISEKIEDLISEAKGLGQIKELILVAQDITRYGIDLYGEKSLVRLIKELSSLDNIENIRLLYCYPDMIDDELINEIKNNDKVIKYIDIPLQHASNTVLKRMNRKGSKEEYISLINKLKEEVPSIAIRSTFIAGFPGETEEEFNELCDFISKAKLFNCGFFAYSREEDTPAYKMKDQIDEDVKGKRVKKLYSLQREISKQNLQKYVGQTVKIVVDGVDYEKGYFYGRPYFFAPDIDGKVYIKSSETIIQGEEYLVKINRCNSYDLFGIIKGKL